MPSRVAACCTLRTLAPAPNMGELASLTAAADMLTSEARMRVRTLIEGSSRCASRITSATMLGQAGMRTASSVAVSSS